MSTTTKWFATRVNRDYLTGILYGDGVRLYINGEYDILLLLGFHMKMMLMTVFSLW